MSHVTRRQAVAGTAALVGTALANTVTAAPLESNAPGRLKQSVCRWCYAKIPLPELCKAVAGLGLSAMDLLTEAEWPVAREHGLICSMGSGFGGTIADGLNVKANHDKIVAGLERGIPLAAANKVRPHHVLRQPPRHARRRSTRQLRHRLNRVKKIAEDHGVTICVELLNSKLDHKDYQGIIPRSNRRLARRWRHRA